MFDCRIEEQTKEKGDLVVTDEDGDGTGYEKLPPELRMDEYDDDDYADEIDIDATELNEFEVRHGIALKSRFTSF